MSQQHRNHNEYWQRERLSCSQRTGTLTKLLVTSLMIACLSILAAAQKKDSCVECHKDMQGALGEPVNLTKGDIHQQRGLSCADCHGGDPSQSDPGGAMNRGKGFVGKPKPTDIPQFCGKCHSSAEFMKKFNPSLRVDQQHEYSTSVHGKLLAGGDQKVATCASCHGFHGVRAVKDPQSSVFALNVAETCSKCHGNAEYMKGYKIPTDQYGKYKLSVHAKTLYEKQDLSAPTCNDCHGNHGAAPPGITSVANVCGQCHVRQASLFQGSPHKLMFDAMQVGECAQCHSNHGILAPTDEMLGVTQGSVCTSCHGKGDGGYQAADKMRGLIDQLTGRMNGAMEVLNRAERAGMDVSRPKFELTGAKDSLTQARVLIHGASADEVEKAIAPGLEIADKGQGAGEEALGEWRFRRKGLGVSLFFVLFLAAVIYLKIRQIESKTEPVA